MDRIGETLFYALSLHSENRVSEAALLDMIECVRIQAPAVVPNLAMHEVTIIPFAIRCGASHAIIQHLRDDGYAIDSPVNGGKSSTATVRLGATSWIVDGRKDKIPERDYAFCSGDNSLHVAVKSGALEIVQYLLLIQLPVHTVNVHGETALSSAAASPRNRFAIVDVLLEAKADPSFYVRKSEREPGHSVLALFILSGSDDNCVDHMANFLGREATKTLLSPRAAFEFPLLSELVNKDGLQISAQYLQKVINIGCEVDAWDEYSGETPLTAALRKKKHPSLIQILLKNGADTNTMVKIRTQLNLNPLFLAQTTEYAAELTNLLLEYGAGVNECQLNGVTPLLQALTERRLDVARILIAAGGDCNAKSSSGSSPMLSIMSPLYPSVVDLCEQMLKTNGSANVANHAGEKSLHLLFKSHWSVFESSGANAETVDREKLSAENTLQLVKMLCRAEANTNAATSQHRFTPLLLALRNQFPDVICAVLFSYGAQPLLKSRGESHYQSPADYPLLAAAVSIVGAPETLTQMLQIVSPSRISALVNDIQHFTEFDGRVRRAPVGQPPSPDRYLALRDGQRLVLYFAPNPCDALEKLQRVWERISVSFRVQFSADWQQPLRQSIARVRSLQALSAMTIRGVLHCDSSGDLRTSAEQLHDDGWLPVVLSDFVIGKGTTADDFLQFSIGN